MFRRNLQSPRGPHLISALAVPQPGDAQAGALSGKGGGLWSTGPRGAGKETGGSIWDGVMGDLDY